MEDRFTLNLIYMGILSALAAIFLSIVVFCMAIHHHVYVELVNIADEVAAAYAIDSSIDDLHLLNKGEYCITIIDADGTIEYGNAAGISNISVENGKYTAENAILSCSAQLKDGSLLIATTDTPKYLSWFSSSIGVLLVGFMCIVAACVGMALILSKRFIRPVKNISSLLDHAQSDIEDNLYPELRPLLTEITNRRNERETMRQEFTANVSHELKTPLTTISGYSEMIATGLVKSEDIPRFAKKIQAESERMQTLVGDIIELNALDSQRPQQHNETISMQALVQDCIEQLSPHFASKKLSVYITGDDFTVQGSKRQLWELVYNLLDNARRYNVENGMIHITLSDHVLSVKDTGIGIAPEYQSRVFERFYRVDKSHSRATGGTGLGLSIVKHVAELHNASIELESAEHVGTEIRICFPQ